VHGGQHEVPRIGRLDGEHRRLQVAHFADEDDVRVLAQGGPQRLGEGLRVGLHLAMVDDALLGLVHEFDGVLDRDDVALAVRVGVLDDGRQRRRLAAARGPRQEHEAPRQHGQLLENLRQPQLVDGENRGGDFAEHGADPVFLLEVVAPVAGDARNLVAEVQVARLLDLLPLAGGEDLEEHLAQLVVVERLVGDLFHVAADAQGRGRSGEEVEVGGAPVVLKGKQIVDSCHRSIPFQADRKAEKQFCKFHALEIARTSS